jgi:hypothetical protein
MDDETVHFVLEAVDMVATHGWKLLPQVFNFLISKRAKLLYFHWLTMDGFFII